MPYQNIGKGINLRNRKYFEAFRKIQKYRIKSGYDFIWQYYDDDLI